MNTEQFLSAILPTSGNYFLALPFKNTSGYKHLHFTDIPSMAARAVAISNRNTNVFFACSSFQQPSYTKIQQDGTTTTHYRTGENALFAKSQWLDLDGDQKENLVQLTGFCKEANFPRPNLYVNSGNGIHVYWTFDKDIPRDGWKKQAEIFKQICAHYGVGQNDTSRTADVSSVLRPIGTNNDKTAKGLGVKPVKLIGTPILEPIKIVEWVGHLKRLQKNLGLKTPKVYLPAAAESDLSGGMEYPPASAAIIADKCNQIRLFRDNKGADQSEPLWRKCLGVLKFTTDGEDLGQEWSSGHSSYTFEGTKTKMDNWNSGPATCDSFRDTFASGCEGCQFNVKSPIQLGAMPPPVDEPVAYVDESGEEIIEEPATLPEEFEDQFMRNAQGLWGYEAKPKGGGEWVLITSSIPEVVDYYYDVEAASWRAVIDAHIKPGVTKRGEIDAKILGQGGSQLLGALASSLFISITPGRTRLMETYVHMWLEKIKRDQNETAMFSHMGWYDDGSFLFGDRQYMPDGEIRQVKLKSTLRKLAESMVPTGNLNRYKTLIDQAYNHPHHEEFQFTWLAGFASVLLHIIHPQPIGIVFNAWSRASGAGKSTASQLAVGIWGKPDIVDADGTTPHALTLNAGMRRNLPMVLDEATNWKGERIGEFAYRYSSGKAKEQGKADGGLRDNSDVNWCNILLTSGNKPMSENMALVYANAAPQMARIWQYRFTENYTSAMSDVEGHEVFQELMGIYGVAGEVFLPYVVKNRAALLEELNKVGSELMDEASMGRDGRNWRMGAACVLVAERITKDLGLHRFDTKALRRWTVARLGDLKSVAKDSVRDLSSAFGDMMADLQGGFIVTRTLRDYCRKDFAITEQSLLPVRSAVTGRRIQDSGDEYIRVASAKKWCKEHDISYNEMKATIASKGWLKETKYFRLGTGTDQDIAPAQCLRINLKGTAGHLSIVNTENDQMQEAV